MHIKDLYKQKKPVISFEVFPPKKDAGFGGIFGLLEDLCGLSPAFISVTYGAGGGGAVNKTKEIAAAIKSRHGVESLAHMTCIGADREKIAAMLDELQAAGVENIMALRGDLPADIPMPLSPHYSHAVDLIRDIKGRGGFCIGAACYPEGHIDAESLAQDILHLREKQEAGADFIVSQLFFDNDVFYRFLEEARAAGVTGPISAGIMPFLSRKQIERMIFMCGASLPSTIIKLLHRYEDDPVSLRQAGIAYAVEQIDGLIRNRVDGVHIYTMNKSDIAASAAAHIKGMGVEL